MPQGACPKKIFSFCCTKSEEFKFYVLKFLVITSAFLLLFVFLSCFCCLLVLLMNCLISALLDEMLLSGRGDITCQNVRYEMRFRKLLLNNLSNVY
jgi:hypothetical protein